jgi:hypothetical protein
MSAPTFNPSKSYRPAPKKAVQFVELVEDEVTRVLDGEADPPPRIEMIEPMIGSIIEKPAPQPQTRAEELADSNKFWDATPVPQKWLTYYELSDLAPFGISDAVNDRRRLFLDISPINDDGSLLGKPTSWPPNRMLNPLYLDGYRAWKAKRFPHGLPARDSSWMLRQQERSDIDACPDLRRVCPPECLCGERLRQREQADGDVHFWEEPYARELYFEIMLTAPRFDGSQPEAKEFFVMFETQGPEISFYKTLEKGNELAKSKSALNDRLEGFFVSGHPIEIRPPKMICRICYNTPSGALAPPHSCGDFTEPEIIPGRARL